MGATTGIGLIEVFEADESDSSQLVNLSTRARTQTADDVMIGGFIIEGFQPKTILIRGRGPSMSSAPFLVSGVLADPVLRLFAGQSMIAEMITGKMLQAAAGLVAELPHRLQPSVWIHVDRILDNPQHQQVASSNPLF